MNKQSEPIQVDERNRALSHLAYTAAADDGMPQEHLERLTAELERIDRLPTKEERNRAGQLLMQSIRDGDYGRPSK